jgi:hypothetical protein
MKRMIISAAALLLSATAVGCTADSSSASSASSCVSIAKAKKLHDGMKLGAVQKLFGRPGHVYASGNGWQNRGFGKQCGTRHELGVLFVKRHGVFVVSCEGRCWL